MKKPWSSVSAIPEFDHDGSHSPMRSKSNGTPVQDRASGPFPLLQNGSVDSAALNDSINEAQTGDTTMSTDVPDDMTRETPAPTIETHPSSTGSPNVLHRRIQVAQESSVAGNSFANDNGIGHTSQASHKRNAPSRNVRISTFSAETSGGSRDKTSGRRSTLREALGKLFGRRKKTSIGRSSSGPDSVRETPDTTEQQNSGPQIETTEGQGHLNAHKRSASLPQDEHGRIRRSHSIGADGDTARMGNRSSLQTRSNFSRRQPGIHSLLRHPGGPSELSSGLSPRPASIHGRVEIQEPQYEAEEEIGKAITTKDFATPRDKRRSRSLSALIGAGKEFGGPQRRLSGEIRYWRESRDLEVKSHISSSHAETEEPHFPLPEEESMPNFAPKSPLQPFTFPEGSSWRELSGMKITLAASLDSRIDHLESRVHNLEDARRNQAVKLNDYRQRGPESKNRRPRNRLNTRGSVSSLSSSDADANYSYTVPTVHSSQRPMSTVTIRGAASLPTLSKDASMPLTIDHYTTLMALLETERSAREALDAQVKAMGHQLRILTKVVESNTPSGLGFTNPPVMSAFDYDEEDDDDDDYDDVVTMKRRSKTNRASKDPQYQTSRGAEDIAMVQDNPSQDEEGYLASFATPPEEFTDEEDSKRRAKSARTLSLSQMTMRKPGSSVPEDPLPNSPL